MPDEDRRRVLAGCEPVELVFSDVLIEPGEGIRHVYFPTNSFISLTTTPTSACASLEVGLVGDEGMLGVSLLLGVDVAPLHALVQGPGPALRMDAAAFHRELDHGPALQDGGLIRYRRGDVTILDRGGLEAAACGCYAADKAGYTRIMG